MLEQHVTSKYFEKISWQNLNENERFSYALGFADIKERGELLFLKEEIISTKKRLLDWNKTQAKAVLDIKTEDETKRAQLVKEFWISKNIEKKKFEDEVNVLQEKINSRILKIITREVSKEKRKLNLLLRMFRKDPENLKKYLLDEKNSELGYYSKLENLGEPDIAVDGVNAWFTGDQNETFEEIILKQKRAIGIWIDFFSEHKDHPLLTDEVKYLVFETMKNCGAYVEGKSEGDTPYFNKRNLQTLAPIFSPRESEEAFFESLNEVKNKYEGDFNLFPAIYANKLKSFNLEERKRIIGDEKIRLNVKWRVFTDVNEIETYLLDKKTGWCLGTGSAGTYIHSKGRVHVGYYERKNPNGEIEEVPVIAVAENIGDKEKPIREIRGRDYGQNLSLEYYPIYEEFVKKYFDSDKVESLKKLKTLTLLRNVVSKMKAGENLNREELFGIMNSKIFEEANFGYHLSPELRVIKDFIENKKSNNEYLVSQIEANFYSTEIAKDYSHVNSETKVFIYSKRGHMYIIFKENKRQIFEKLEFVNFLRGFCKNEKGEFDDKKCGNLVLSKEQTEFIWSENSSFYEIHYAFKYELKDFFDEFLQKVQEARNAEKDYMTLFGVSRIKKNTLEVIYNTGQKNYARLVNSLLNSRNIKADLSKLYGVSKRFVSEGPEEITKYTKVYYEHYEDSPGIKIVPIKGDLLEEKLRGQLILNKIKSKIKEGGKDTKLSREELSFIYGLRKPNKYLEDEILERVPLVAEYLKGRDVTMDMFEIIKSSRDKNTLRKLGFLELAEKLQSKKELTTRDLYLLYTVNEIVSEKQFKIKKGIFFEKYHNFDFMGAAHFFKNLSKLAWERELYTKEDIQKILELKDEEIAEFPRDVNKDTIYFNGEIVCASQETAKSFNTPVETIPNENVEGMLVYYRTSRDGFRNKKFLTHKPPSLNFVMSKSGFLSDSTGIGPSFFDRNKTLKERITRRVFGEKNEIYKAAVESAKENVVKKSGYEEVKTLGEYCFEKVFGKS